MYQVEWLQSTFFVLSCTHVLFTDAAEGMFSPYVLLDLCINKIRLNIVLFVPYCCLPVIIRMQLISLVAQKKDLLLMSISSGLLVDGKRRGDRQRRVQESNGTDAVL